VSLDKARSGRIIEAVRTTCLRGFAAVGVSLAVALALSDTAVAAPAITATPNQSLTDGATVTVSGSGYTPGPGAVLECNAAPGEPTIPVAGNQVPVGCSNPLSKLINADASGNVPSTPFTVKQGVVGPPATGTDSAGKDAAADAALYPCPPTAAQQAAGVTCVIALGDSAQHQATQPITFQSQVATTTTAAGATTTAVTNPPVVESATTTTAAPASTAFARTGPSPLMLALAVGGLIVLDAGYLLFSSTRRPRPLFRRRA
jgi:hypothetical protein